MSADEILSALDPDQRAVAEALRGPVCVLAGAGTGKTRAITHRIAYGVASGVYNPTAVLAVTFTARAAGEMRTRLRELGVAGVQARTFHAAALRQLGYFWPQVVGGPVPKLLEHKAPVVAEAATRLGLDVDRVAVRDLAGEVEWAKVSLVTADDYVRAATAVDRPAPAGFDRQTVARLLSAYDTVIGDRGMIDFEDVLQCMAAMLTDHHDVADAVRSQYRYFVVDEYQDVSPLQQFLLDQWLGGRTELCVVGDPSQTIYSFTGASPRYLLDFAKRHRGATVVRLVRDYRSTPQVVHLANSVIGRHAAGGVRPLELVAQRRPGPVPAFRAYDDDAAEAQGVAIRVERLAQAGVPLREIAVLYRTNAQSEAFEQAMAERGIGYLVRGGERFFSRREVREALLLLRGAMRSAAEAPMPQTVRDVFASLGWTEQPPAARGAARERWDSLQALVALADQLHDSHGAGMAELVEELDLRAAAQHAPTVEGVTLSSLHAAKGLEWDVVFLTGLSEGLLPISLVDTDEAVAEERRLLYVGITRARERLELSYARARTPGGRAGRRRTRFLDGLWPEDGSSRGAAGRSARRPAASPLGEHDGELFDALRSWRQAKATEVDRPAFTVLSDAALTEIAVHRPGTVAELAQVRGIGPAKIELFGAEVLAVVRASGGPMPGL